MGEKWDGRREACDKKEGEEGEKGITTTGGDWYLPGSPVLLITTV